MTNAEGLKVWDVRLEPRTVPLAVLLAAAEPPLDFLGDEFPNDRDWAESLDTAKVGQWVVMTNGQGGRHARVDIRQISKVGRKNVYLDIYQRDVPFSVETGSEVRSKHAGGPGMNILTIWSKIDDVARSTAIHRLAGLGIEIRRGYQPLNLSYAQLMAIADIVEFGPSS